MTSAVVFILNLVLLPHFTWILVITIAACLARSLRGVPDDFTPKSRFLIIIPAHNEEHGISKTVRSCLGLNYPGHLFETLVLADNCCDGTAERARQSGAAVVERHNLGRKSKGFALEDLFDQLGQAGRFETIDAMAIIDADTTVDPGLLLAFAKRVESGEDWIQAYDTVGNPEDSWRTRLMTYAFCLINGTILLGQGALGLSGGLRGNGMCLTTRGLRKIPWSSHGLAEDEEFSWTLRLAGETIAFEPSAIVHAVMLREGGEAAAAQRRRWEYGRKEARRRTMAPLLRGTNLSGVTKLCSLIELTLPNTVNIVIVYVLATFLNVYSIYSEDVSGPVARALLVGSTGLMTASLVLYALSPFLIFRLPWRFGASLAYFPIYAVWKLAVMLQGRPREWVRAHRIYSEQPMPISPNGRLHPPSSFSESGGP